MTFNEYLSKEDAYETLTERLASDLKAELAALPRATLCVPGGTTPGPIFDRLCQAPLDWEQVNVVLNDERWVNEAHERSNTALLKKRLLCQNASKATYISLYKEAEAPEDRLSEIEETVEAALPISVLLLGMGADMHTASIFPEADNLDLALSSDAPTLLAMRAPNAPEPRITMSANVLNAAAHKHLLIFGDEKRLALEAAKELTPREAPIHAVLENLHIHWAP